MDNVYQFTRAPKEIVVDKLGSDVIEKMATARTGPVVAVTVRPQVLLPKAVLDALSFYANSGFDHGQAARNALNEIAALLVPPPPVPAS